MFRNVLLRQDFSRYFRTGSIFDMSISLDINRAFVLSPVGEKISFYLTSALLQKPTHI